MNFECGNCRFTLTNEFCPKCGQRMEVGCDLCARKDAAYKDLAKTLDDLVKLHHSMIAASEAKRISEVTDLRERYEKTIDDQWRELEDLRRKEATWKVEKEAADKIYEHGVSEAWTKVADVLEVKVATGYRIDEARVLQQLRVERSAASLLRTEVADLKRQLAGSVDEFARQREEFLEHLQNKNGAARLEAPKTEV